MADETRELAKFAVTLTYEQIPVEIRRHAIDLLVDQLGCEVGCSDLPWAKQVRDTYRKNGGSPQATVVRYGDRLPVMQTAFINSTFGHSFEYDDGNTLIHGHPGAELIPALIAVAEYGRVSGREFLTTLVSAYEVRGRIGWAATPDMRDRGGPQVSTTCGPFGVAAGVGRLLGLDAEGVRNALGIAGTFSGGLMQYDHGGGSVKRIFCAVGGSAGIQAAHLAQSGMTGPEEILEGTRGLLRLYAPAFRRERLVADLGKMWTLELVRFKPHCCVGAIHPAIDALKKLVTANNLKADDIESVEVGYRTGIHEHAAITEPHDLLGMQFSTAYTLALTMLKGRNTPREYRIEALQDPAIRAFAAKVQVREHADLNKPEYERLQIARVRLHTRSGKTCEELMLSAKGSSGTPLTSVEIDDKFRSQVSDILGAQKCEQVLKTLRNIDALDDMAQLPPLLVAA